MKKLSALSILILFGWISVSAQFQIGHRSVTFNDPDRSGRAVDFELYYPATSAGDNVPFESGAFPLVVFGHGFAITWSEYSIWWEELVPEGYIMAFPTTEGSVFPTPDHGAFGMDLTFIINALMDENTTTGSLYEGKFSGLNAVMGHSMGGGCSFLSAGSGDAPIATMISLAAAETDPSSIAAAANVSVNTLTISGSSDCVVMAGGAPIDMYNGLTSTPYKALLDITQGSHCQFGNASFGSICTIGELGCTGSFIDAATQHAEMFASTKPWLDFHLKNDCDAWSAFKDHLYNGTGHTYQESGELDDPVVTVDEMTTVICTGDEFQLNAVVDGSFCNASWYLDGASLEESALNLSVTAGGTYTYEVTNADGSPFASGEIVVMVAEPFAITVSFMGGDLTANFSGPGTAMDFQWYYEGAPIDGANTAVYTPTENGNYYVEIMDEHGCVSVSPTENVVLSSLQALEKMGVSVYPTLAVDELRIKIRNANLGLESGRILDVTGQVVSTFPGRENRVGVSHLTPGVYILILELEGQQYPVRFVKGG